MTIFQALILGLLQGLTEFLPVSSSGHLVIAQHWFNLAQPPVVFDILVHLATASVVVIFLLPTLLKLNRRLVSLLLVGSLPAGFVGLLLNQYIEALFSSLPLVGLALLITAALLFSTRFFKPASKSQPSFKDSFIIGSFQALAIIPGISRSGSTIVAALSRRLRPEQAFNFSFLLAIPAIFGAQLIHLNDLASATSIDLPVFLTGFLTAFVSGFLALKLLRQLVIKGRLGFFSLYCLLLGLFTLLNSSL